MGLQINQNVKTLVILGTPWASTAPELVFHLASLAPELVFYLASLTPELVTNFCTKIQKCKKHKKYKNKKKTLGRQLLVQKKQNRVKTQKTKKYKKKHKNAKQIAQAFSTCLDNK